MILKFIVCVVILLNHLTCFVHGVPTIQVNRGPQLSLAQLGDLENAYKDLVKKSRVQKVEGEPRQRGSSRRHQVSQSDIQNDRILAYADIILLGTVNFNQQLPDIIKGDVYPNPGEMERIKQGEGGVVRRVRRKAIDTQFNVVEKWDNGVLPYRVTTSSYADPDAVRAKIRSSLIPIEENSCVRFQEVLPTQVVDSSQSLVEVRDNLACASTIGRVPGRSQVLSLALGCLVTGTIQHEFMHALGFGHEHERPDRDDFVAINSKYIQQQYIGNFDKEPFPTYSTDISYDLSSIMHYSQNQFSIDLSSNTIELTDPYLAISALDIGQRIGFSWLDEVAMNKYYNCEKDCSTPCQNGGYVRKLTTGVCRCICPPGLSGSSCEEVVNSCGEYVDLSLTNGEKIITSQNFDGVRSSPSNDVCYYFIKGQGYLELTFTHFDITCDNTLEVRSFHISQPTLGLCGDTEPAPVRTIYSPTPDMIMLIYDTTKSVQGERGWSLTAKSHTDACLHDPCHGAKCTPVPGSDTQYVCDFPKHPMHCEFDQGRLGACTRVKFNKYYQKAEDFQLAWQVASNSNPHMLTSTDVTDRLQRGVASIIPHDFTGKRWCFSFKYRINGDDEATVNLHLVKNKRMDSTSLVFTDTDDRVSFYSTRNINIDGTQYADSDMVELVFEVLYRDVGPRIDTIDIDGLHLVPQQCPASSDPCASFPCGDRECHNVNNVAVCTYPDTDIHCGFETSENGCQADIEFFGKFHSVDDSDWTLYSGPTLTPGTGPDKAAVGEGYLYVESNFPPVSRSTAVRSAYLRLSPRRSGDRCLAFRYHMHGSTVERLVVQVATYDSFEPGITRLLVLQGQQGNEWKYAQVNVTVNDRLDSVKIQVEIIAAGRSKFSDIAIDDIHLTKGACDRSPVDGKWMEWGSYTDCSDTCTKTRTRSCISPTNGGAACSGESSETASCESNSCSVDGRLSDWSDWGTCQVTCGGGIVTRTRICVQPKGAGAPCPTGDLTQNQPCGANPCPIDGIWQPWGSWGTCSANACGLTGTQLRERLCTPPQNNGLPCDGSNRENQSCSTPPCVPVNGKVSEWNEWSECSKSCGSGQRQRTRECVEEAVNGGLTCETLGLSHSELCNTNGCPIDATVSNWMPWSACSTTCGDGTRTRIRVCLTKEQNGGKRCDELGLNDEENCKVIECPVDAQVSDWTGWSGCSKTCGEGGQVSRSRTCLAEAQHGGESCAGKGLSETKPCDAANFVACKVDAVLSSWTTWTACTATCGGGERRRERTCDAEGQGGGKSCSEFSLTQQLNCNTDPCPVDGVLSPWSVWSACSVTCGEGKTERSRTCSPAEHGGVSCSSASLLESEPCFVKPDCPIDGVLTDWTDWGACSVSCDEGRQTRSRSCIPAQNGGNDCGDGLLEQIKSCSLEPCPVDGKLSEWSAWSECSKPCSSGTKSRSRTCVAPQNGGRACSGELEETNSCNTQACKIDGVWKPWTSWVCSVTCGSGTEERHRECDGPFNGGESCNGESQQRRPCQASISNCPVDSVESDWSSWSSCSVTCGRGTKLSTRTCVPPQFGGKVCGPIEKTSQCLIRHCQVNGFALPWTPWGQCSVTCGTGTHSRTRVCTPPRHGGRSCNSHLSETKGCLGILPSCTVKYHDWSHWSACSASCGPSGERTRKRSCHGNALCDGIDRVETTSCNQHIICPRDGSYGEWMQWGSCSVSCGDGVQLRKRICTPPIGNGKACIGDPEQSRTCSTRCAVDSSWQPWTNWAQCSTTCGPGSVSRSRVCTPPVDGGRPCSGPRTDQKGCSNNPPCAANGFSQWSDWSRCSTSTCRSSNPRAFQTRQRRCIGRCGFGRTFEIQHCVPDCSTNATTTTTTTSSPVVSGRVDGNWGEWEQWTECEQPCVGQRSRSRACDSPAPQSGGISCDGDSLMSEDCAEAPDCNELVGNSGARMCQGFEEGRSLQKYGQAVPSRSGYKIQSGPSKLYFTGGFGRTGPSWAPEGSSYLLLASTSLRRQDFRFDAEFNYKDGACVKFKYNTHGESWDDGKLELALISKKGNRYSQAMWSHDTQDRMHWQSATVSIPEQNFIFEVSRLVLIVNGGGSLRDLGFDDLQVGQGSCDSYPEEICQRPEGPRKLSCSFEEGDDCSWVDRNVGGSIGLWKVWRGSTSNPDTGPTSTTSGSNYIYADTESSLSLIVPAGQGCLEFSYHMLGSRRLGTLLVKIVNGRRIFRTNQGRGKKWARRQLNVFIPEGSDNEAQILIQYQTRANRTKKDVAIDNIKYRKGTRC